LLLRVRRVRQDGAVATFIALLRAVNLGRTRKLPMAQAKEWLTEAGFDEVETYIQTGNVRMGTSMRSRARVGRLVEQVLEDRCGFDVPAVVLTPSELRRVYDDAVGLVPPLDGEVRRYVTFLKATPDPEAVAAVDAWAHEGERARVVGPAVHWWLAKSSHAARLSNARLEAMLGTGTTRDLNVVTTLAQRWGR
jgi:uncharacterized protein (DUF1697 family)